MPDVRGARPAAGPFFSILTRKVDAAKWLWCTASADHVTPQSRGGSTDLKNLLTSCAGCNYGKNDRTLGDLRVIAPQDNNDAADEYGGASLTSTSSANAESDSAPSRSE